MTRILVADKLAESGLERLRQAGVDFDVRTGLPTDELARTIKEYDGILIRSAVKLTSEVLAEPGKLRAIARAGVGVDNVDLDAATEAGVLVLNTPDANTLSTAEHTFAMLLSVHRRIPDACVHVREGQWKRAAFQGDQLAGRTLGVVGLGRIGRAVALRALAFEMNVIAYDPFVSGDTALDGSVSMRSDLTDLLREADCITLHSSLSDDTRHMIGANELALMKPSARLVNCARGALIDEAALADALNNGRIAGAALDVFESEPPTGSPLLSACNVVLTPHLAASTAEAQRRVSLDAVDALVAYLQTGEIRSAVNVAGMPRNLTRRQRAYVDLCARIGAMLSLWARQGVERIVVTVNGESLHELAPTLSWQAMASIVGPHLDVRLSLVNARDQAKRRGIVVEHIAHAVSGDRPESISVSLHSRGKQHEISGTIFGDQRPRILSIDGYPMEMVPDRTMLLIFNDDRPGVIGLVGKAFGDARINIADMTLSRRGDTALMVLKLDDPAPDEMLASLRKLNPPIQAVHAVSLPTIGNGS